MSALTLDWIAMQNCTAPTIQYNTPKLQKASYPLTLQLQAGNVPLNLQVK